MKAIEFKRPIFVAASGHRGKRRSMRVESMVLCEDVRLRSNGTYDLIGAGAEVFREPLAQGFCCVFVLLRVSHSEQDKCYCVRIALIGDDGCEISSVEREPMFTRIPGYREGAEMPYTVVADFRSTKIVDEGRYAVTVSCDGGQIAITEFEVVAA